MTKAQQEILLHCTGNRLGDPSENRNYYVGGCADLQALKSMGFMYTQNAHPELVDGGTLWRATPEGLEKASEIRDAWLAAQPKLSRSAIRYRDWVEGYSEWCTFKEYLKKGMYKDDYVQYAEQSWYSSWMYE